MEYGVLVNNKFALFDDEDEDPLEVLQRTQDAVMQNKAAKENTNTKSKVAAKNAKNTSKSVKTESKQPTKVLTPSQEQKLKTSTQNVPPRRDNVAEKPPRFRQNENALKRPPRDDSRDLQRTESDFRTERIELRSDESSGRGMARRGRGGQGRGWAVTDGGFDRFGKREFERHSGSDRTGLKPVEKREGGGAHNWGTIADAVAEQEQLAANQSTNLDQTVDGDTTGVTGNDSAEVEKTEAEEEKQLTLDEWKALQERGRAKPAFNIRKPGEGCQTAPEWKKMYVLKKKVVDEDEEEEEEEYDEDEDVRGKQKATVPIAIRFNDSNARGGAGRRGRGRGGPGGGPGRRQETGDRPPRGPSAVVDAVPNVDNELDFPSLA